MQIIKFITQLIPIQSVILTIAAFFLMFPGSGYAMHIIGGEILYEYVGAGTVANTNKYKFTMKIYRDCFGGGADFDSPANIAIYEGSYQVNSLFDAFTIGNASVTKIIPDTPACVSNFPNVCVEEGLYTFTRDLPNSTKSYWIVYQRCCRNTTINNIFDPGQTGATFVIELKPQATQVQNNSPSFNGFPPIVICNNIPFTFDHSATDPDGDQLVYSFCSPFDGGGPALTEPALFSCFGALPTPPCSPPFDNVAFLAPDYTPAVPMGGDPVISIDPVTGLITGTPLTLGQFVVGVCVDEYRNGVLLSSLKRDFQFNVASCVPDVFAKIQTDSIAGPKNYVITSCGDEQLLFINESTQANKINDNRWVFDLNGTPFSTTDWNALVTFPDTGVYNGKLYLNELSGCGDSATIQVRIFPDIEAEFNYVYDTCVAGPVDFTDLSVSDAGPILLWDWQFGDPTGSSTIQNPSYLYHIPGNHDVKLTVWDKNRCKDDTIQTINWFPAPPVLIIQPDKFLGCTPAEITFTNLSSPIDSTYYIKWTYGDGSEETGVISPTHIYPDEGFYDVSVEIISPIGCKIAGYYPDWIKVVPSPIAAFTYTPDTLLSNFNNTVQFIDQSIDPYRWNWVFGTTAQSSILQNPTHTFQDTGQVKVTLTVTHQQGCKDTASVWLDIAPRVLWHMPNAFTPNGNGLNESFYGKGFMDGARDFRFTVWNRWGELVFETTDPEGKWNGRVHNNGGMSPAGVYVWQVNYTTPRGEPVNLRGFATLVN